jgi:multisubunit Na+/H+ antiporter MnhG subunit
MIMALLMLAVLAVAAFFPLIQMIALIKAESLYNQTTVSTMRINQCALIKSYNNSKRYRNVR